MSDKLKVSDIVSIAELEKTVKGNLWVLNTTVSPTRANVVIEVSNSAGSKTQVIIPATFIPLNLTDQVPKKFITQSDRFRQAVFRKLIVPVTEEYAKRVLSSEGASTELERLRTFTSNASVVHEASISNVMDTNKHEQESWKVGLSQPVVTLCELMESTGETEALNTSRNMGTLARKEYREIAKRARDLKFRKLRQWARDNMETEAA